MIYYQRSKLQSIGLGRGSGVGFKNVSNVGGAFIIASIMAQHNSSLDLVVIINLTLEIMAVLIMSVPLVQLGKQMKGLFYLI